ncbi:unnamed protein product [Vicia faba]|uniref:Uncharacterized protein n=1 Tax=Vicia faba TaxID=3906 RepID=A0AAV1AI99_VICFA|nr:unnamed protein product [Vicia faba]
MIPTKSNYWNETWMVMDVNRFPVIHSWTMLADGRAYEVAIGVALLQRGCKSEGGGSGGYVRPGELTAGLTTASWLFSLKSRGGIYTERGRSQSCVAGGLRWLLFLLVTYLTTKLHEGNVSAARNVGVWQGTCYLTPLIGVVLADSYWGRYWTIAVFSMIYFLGMSILTISASVPSLKPVECVDSVCPPASPLQYYLFYFGLYLVALGTGGVKSCVSPFGADQFDETDFVGSIKKASFFNWYYFSIMIGAIVSCTFIVWVQDNLGWGLGFGIPALFMGLTVGSFFLGFVSICPKADLVVPEDSSLMYETPDKQSGVEGSRKLMHHDDLRYFDRAAVVSDSENRSGEYSNPWRLCTVTQVEELKILIRMLPIWATGIIFSAVYAQMSTLFVEQGTMMNTYIGSFKLLYQRVISKN